MEFLLSELKISLKCNAIYYYNVLEREYYLKFEFIIFDVKQFISLILSLEMLDNYSILSLKHYILDDIKHRILELYFK